MSSVSKFPWVVFSSFSCMIRSQTGFRAFLMGLPSVALLGLFILVVAGFWGWKQFFLPSLRQK